MRIPHLKDWVNEAVAEVVPEEIRSIEIVITVTTQRGKVYNVDLMGIDEDDDRVEIQRLLFKEGDPVPSGYGETIIVHNQKRAIETK